MPVRSRIHSSFVSIVAARSSFVTVRWPTAVPQPVKRAPLTLGGIAGIGVS